MRRQDRSAGWYEAEALKWARRTSDTDEIRKHLKISWLARNVGAYNPSSFTMAHLRGLEQCYDEGAELLNPDLEVIARRIGSLATVLYRLRRTRGSDRLFLLSNQSESSPQYMLGLIQPFSVYEESQRALHEKKQYVSPFLLSLRYTKEQAMVGINRVQEVISDGYDEINQQSAKTVPIAEIPLPWKIDSQELTPTSEPWFGTLVVGRRAIDEWAAAEHDDERAAAFAERIRVLPEDA